MQNNWDKIYKEHFYTVYKYLLCLTHDANLSEDLTQETFYKAILKINSFKGNSSLTTWLCEIAKNLLLNELKRSKKINFVQDEILETLTASESVEQAIISNEEKEILKKKIENLDETTRKSNLFKN